MTVASASSLASRAPALSLNKVSKSFGAVAALTDVDLEVHAGEVVALVGDNGAGKSTLVKVLAGVHPQDSGTVTFGGKTVKIESPSAARELGIATVFQDLALCENLSVVENLFLGQEIGTMRLDETTMENRSWELLRELSAKIPTVRIQVAALSGGQRQTVAIARSLLGDPQLILLDEPTAALGVEQTAEVLNLVDRLRERGLAVLMISHNMVDVKAVADRVAVLRLGRNNGIFDAAEVSTEDIVAAITGATDNKVTQRAGRADTRGTTRPGGQVVNKPAETEETATAADLLDERLKKQQSGLRGLLGGFFDRLRGGDLGTLPVIAGLVVIFSIMYFLNDNFLSPRNLVNLTLQASDTGIIALGIVVVLLVAQIDLSVGSMSGVAAAVTAITYVEQGWPLAFAVMAAVLTGCLVGLALRGCVQPVRHPQLRDLAGRTARLARSRSSTSVAVRTGHQHPLRLEPGAVRIGHVPGPWQSYVLVAIAAGGYLAAGLARARERRAANLSSASLTALLVKAGLLAAGLAVGAYVLNQARGVSYMLLLFVGLVLVMQYMLTRTKWGRSVFAVGGNVEAARRAGINVRLIYASAFITCTALAALGGVLAAARLTTASTDNRNRRCEPQRHRSCRDRWNQPLRRSRLGLCRVPRHRGDPVDIQRTGAAQPGVLDPVHGHGCGPAPSRWALTPWCVVPASPTAVSQPRL